MIVLHVRSSPFLGSPERMLLAQIRALGGPGSGYIVAVLDEQRHGPNEFAEAVRKAGGRVVECPGTAWALPIAVARMAQAIRRRNVRVICTHDYKANLAGVMAGALTRVPIVAVFHGRTSHDWKVRLYERLDEYVMRLCRSIVAVSRASGDVLERRGHHGRRVRVISNGVDVDERRNAPALDVRKELGLPAEGPLVVYLGRISAEKGLGFLVEAAAGMARRWPDLRVLILGDGPETARLRADVEARGLEEHLRLIGFRQDVRPYLRAMDLLVLPSFTEGMPVSILEAFAWEKPVVASRVGGVPEVVEHGVSGLLVEPGDAEALAAAIGELIADPDRARRMGEVAGRRVRERFGSGRQAAEFKALFDTVGTQGGSGTC